MENYKFEIERKFMDELQVKTGMTNEQIINHALGVYKSLIDEIKQGRVILTSDEDGKYLTKINIKILT